MTFPAESIRDYVIRKLKEAGPSRFEAIADETGVALSYIRKFRYGSRHAPRLDKLQPLISLFSAVDRGERSMPLSKKEAEVA